MKPRLPGGIRVREPRIDPQPPPHERDDERLTRPTEDAEPVDLPDGDDDSEEEPTDNQPDLGGGAFGTSPLGTASYFQRIQTTSPKEGY